MNRRHDAEEAIRAIKKSQDAGFDNISIDLIYGLPNQDVKKFNFSIKKALDFSVLAGLCSMQTGRSGICK